MDFLTLTLKKIFEHEELKAMNMGCENFGNNRRY